MELEESEKARQDHLKNGPKSAMDAPEGIAMKKRKLRLSFPEVLSVSSSEGQLGADQTNSSKSPQKTTPGMLLTSPDLSALGLSSPDLEQYILRTFMQRTPSQGPTTLSPTSAQFLVPKSVTEEQEIYAKGFVDALQSLHYQNSGVSNVLSTSNQQPTPVSINPFLAVTHPYVTQPSGYAQQNQSAINPSYQGGYPQIFVHAGPGNGGTIMSLSGCAVPIQFMPLTSGVFSQAQPLTMTSPPAHPAFPPPYQPQIKSKNAPQRSSASPTPSPASVQSDGAQTVPGRTSSADSVTDSLEPVQRRKRQKTDSNEESDHSEVSLQRTDRKRERNRLAAAKCRQRKMDRIQQLEERVTVLTNENENLSQSAQELRASLFRSKQELTSHIKSGCQIPLPDVVRKSLDLDNFSVDD